MLWLLNLDYLIPIWLIRICTMRIIKKVKKYNLDGINVRAGKLLSQSFITKVKKYDLLIYTWTVNDPDHAKILIDNISGNEYYWPNHSASSQIKIQDISIKETPIDGIQSQSFFCRKNLNTNNLC